MTRRRLSLLLVLFFLALAIPSSILVYQAYGQLKWEAFHQHQRLARDLTRRIDADFNELIQREENRPTSDYEFLNVTGTDEQGFLQRSPLSAFPVESEVPGLLGYFQVDGDGQLRTPLVPKDEASNFGISSGELRQRKKQENFIRGILGQNRLVVKMDLAVAPVLEAEQESADLGFSNYELDSRSNEAVSVDRLLGQAELVDDRDGGVTSAFDELATRKSAPAESKFATEQVKDLKLEDRYDVAVVQSQATQVASEKKKREKRLRKEQVNLPQTVSAERMALQESVDFDDEVTMNEPVLNQQLIRIQTFESDVEAMEFALLDSGHFVLFRRVWQDRERYIQGILVDQNQFIDALIAPAFRESSLSSMSRLIVAYQGSILRNFDADYDHQYRPKTQQANRELLYQSRLIAPFDDIELIYVLARLPIGAGGQVIFWSALILTLVLVGGCFMLFRLGLRQLALARQQQDFVSAVSHELKTPLTSIRMYGEMLRAGWADEDKRRSYYDFIFHEAERLTRLINNVLQLARISRNEQDANLDSITVEEALRELRPRLESQLEPSGFTLNIDGDETVGERRMRIDLDWFLQIVINLVDNAIKFSGNGAKKRIDIRYQLMQDGRLQLSVRDYGPGIAPDQMKKIFTLFYRSENELTRETVGTGIGLALVRQLAAAMQAEVDVVNSDPGAEFRLRFPPAA